MIFSGLVRFLLKSQTLKKCQAVKPVRHFKKLEYYCLLQLQAGINTWLVTFICRQNGQFLVSVFISVKVGD